MNFLVSHIARQPPIKVIHRRKYKEGAVVEDPATQFEAYKEKQACVNIFHAGFGYMPLVKSVVRLDPVLFKDSVSNKRKKFRKIELMQ